MATQNGLLSGMRPRAIHIGTSTISPRLSDERGKMQHEIGSYYIAGPVAGRLSAADTGQLVTLLAGSSESIKAASSLISTYAPQGFVIGKSPALASTAKFIVNFLAASAMELIG